MKAFIAIVGLLSTQLASAADYCRVAIHDMDKLLGQNTSLTEAVNKKLEKKNIVLIDESELGDGDFSIPRLIAVYNGKPNIPMHKFKFNSKTKVGLVPCVAFPLCSPVYSEKQISGISGIKYNHNYSVQVVRGSKSHTVLDEKFVHAFNGTTVSWQDDAQYDGSSEQEDLALAIAEDIPKCSKLIKARKN